MSGLDGAFWVLVLSLAVGCRPHTAQVATAPDATSTRPIFDARTDRATPPADAAASPRDAEPSPSPALHARSRPPPPGAFVDVAASGAVLEATPAGYRFDGDVAEWSSTLTTSIPNEDGTASVAFALTDLAFHVAGDVDAHLGATLLDHVRVHLALEPPILPPIAFMSHLNGAIVDEAWCRNDVTKETPGGAVGVDVQAATDDCLAWLARCDALRAQIEDRFERVIDIDLAAAKVTGATGARVAVHRREAGAGASFELEVPLEAMPETSEMPLRVVRVAARLFSLTPAKRRAGVPEEPVWSVSVRHHPLALHRMAPLVEHILAEAAASASEHREMLRVAASYVPAPTSKMVRFFFNVGEAGQWVPYEISPQVAELDITRGRMLITLAACPAGGGDDAGAPCAAGGDITISAHPSFFDDTYGKRHPKVSLVSRRGDTVLDVSESTSFDPYTLVKREPGVHVLDIYQGPGGPYGSGPSGMMPGYSFEIVTMDAAGRFGRPRPFDLSIWRGDLRGADGLAGFGNGPLSSDPTLWVGAGLELFGLRGKFITDVRSDGGDLKFVSHTFKAGYRWDAAKRDYVRFGRAQPDVDGG